MALGVDVIATEPKVIVRDLRKRYGTIEAVRGVSFVVEDGEIFGLLGPNGAGKTTTVECVVGLREPDGGTIVICGIDARQRPRDVKQRIGAALQTSSLQDQITPREALALFGSFYPKRSRPGDLLERFGLLEKADAPFDSLSSGQRQRLALALAFVNEPELVLLDEPTAGLDARSRRELHREIRRMKGEGYTVLLTTHLLQEAESLCDRVAVLDRGQIVASGSTADLIAASSNAPKVTIHTSRALDRAQLERMTSVSELEVDGVTSSFRTREVNRTLADLINLLHTQRVDILELHVQKDSLEDVFLALTSSGANESPTLSQ